MIDGTVSSPSPRPSRVRLLYFRPVRFVRARARTFIYVTRIRFRDRKGHAGGTLLRENSPRPASTASGDFRSYRNRLNAVARIILYNRWNVRVDTSVSHICILDCGFYLTNVRKSRFVRPHGNLSKFRSAFRIIRGENNFFCFCRKTKCSTAL